MQRENGFSGTWRNELGSTMMLNVDGDRVQGTYESPVSTGGGPARGDLVGFANADHISFVVNWPTGALTAWVGQLRSENGREVIQTLWHMVRGDADVGSGEWQAVLSGTDHFHR